MSWDRYRDILSIVHIPLQDILKLAEKEMIDKFLEPRIFGPINEGTL